MFDDVDDECLMVFLVVVVDDCNSVRGRDYFELLLEGKADERDGKGSQRLYGREDIVALNVSTVSTMLSQLFDSKSESRNYDSYDNCERLGWVVAMGNKCWAIPAIVIR